MTHNDERRAEPRYEEKDAITLKIVFSSENPGLLGKTLEGATHDVSASGLCIQLDRPIVVDSVLDIMLTNKRMGKKFSLTGNVRWCRETSQPGQYQIGLVLRERTDQHTDLAEWRQVFD